MCTSSPTKYLPAPSRLSILAPLSGAVSTMNVSSQKRLCRDLTGSRVPPSISRSRGVNLNQPGREVSTQDSATGHESLKAWPHPVTIFSWTCLYSCVRVQSSCQPDILSACSPEHAHIPKGLPAPSNFHAPCESSPDNLCPT